VFLPAVGMVGVLLTPKANAELAAKVIALVTSVRQHLTLIVGVGIVTRFDWSMTVATQLGVSKQWIPLINARYDIGVDGIGLAITYSCRCSQPSLVIIYSWDHFPEPHNPSRISGVDAAARSWNERNLSFRRT
jgi:NADH:ubiquinone oxidoreductase subunit 4 (subunit M)